MFFLYRVAQGLPYKQAQLFNVNSSVRYLLWTSRNHLLVSIVALSKIVGVFTYIFTEAFKKQLDERMNE